jgi:hypothetical protein
MDKSKYILNKRIPQKRGFALLLTLSALTAIIALTGVLMSYFTEVRKDTDYTKSLIQANLYYSDIQKVFAKFSDKKQLYATLYQTPIPLVSEKKNFSLMLRCRPLRNGININWLSLNGVQKFQEQYDIVNQVLSSIVQKYDLADEILLKDLLLQEISNNKTFLELEYSRLRQKNGIISYRQFEKIILKYQLEADDKNIVFVPWENFFTFLPMHQKVKENLIDGNYLSKELISILFNIEIAIVEEEWIEGISELKKFVVTYGENYNYNIFTQNFLAYAHCEVKYRYGKKNFQFNFTESQGKVEKFEFHAK